MNFAFRRLLAVSFIAAFAGIALIAQIPEPKVTIVNNTFICAKTPKLTIKIPSDFTYLGHVQDFSQASDFLDDNDVTHQQKDAYIFADNTNPDSPKVFSITFLRTVAPHWIIFDDLHERLPENRYFEKGRFKLGGTNYRTATFVGNLFTQKQLAFLIDHDIKVPRYFTIREMEGNVTFADNVKVCFTFAQDIRDLNGSCSTEDSLTDAQKTLLNDFISSANRLFDTVGAIL